MRNTGSDSLVVGEQVFEVVVHDVAPVRDIGRPKIGQSFVRGLPHSINDAGITTAILAMARSLELDVIAEGVETSMQRAFLRNAQCPKLQGYFFSRPVPPEDMERLLRRGCIRIGTESPVPTCRHTLGPQAITPARPHMLICKRSGSRGREWRVAARIVMARLVLPNLGVHENIRAEVTVPMLERLMPARLDPAGTLTKAIAAERFCQVLPQNDPVAAQRAISEALSDLAVWNGPGRDQVRALLPLDQRSHALSEALLVNYATIDAQRRPLEMRCWQSALELSQSLALAFEHFLVHIRNEPSLRVWRRYAPIVLLRLFQHRQVALRIVN